MYDQSPYLMRANELYQLISKVGAETIQEQIKESSPGISIHGFFQILPIPSDFSCARWRGSRHPGRSGEGF